MSKLDTALLAAVLAAHATPAWANLDVAFVLDTTGSMSSEIREAKERIQQIAQALTKDRGQERIRFGVVAYRDRGDAYVTKVSPLTPSVDDTFTFLAELRADGGGDTPEDVMSGLRVALDDLSWDLGAGTERQIFLIGDAPAHLDYQDGAKPEQVMKRAAERRIVINTIGCRSLSQDGITFFRNLAFATEGSYQHIGRVGGPGSGSLAGALLKALVPEAEERIEDGTPIGLMPAQGRAPAESAALTAEISGCALRVSLPPGVRLSVPPSLVKTDKRVVTQLRLAPSGDAAAGVEVFPLSSCLPKATPIQIKIDS